MLSSVGLNWSDPYVGQLMGFPVHFGVGLSVGAGFMDLDTINGVTSANDTTNVLNNAFNLTPQTSLLGFPEGTQLAPVYVAEFRMGGFAGLPFDFGGKFGMLPSIPLWGTASWTFTMFGGDIHINLLDGKRGGAKLSVGVGFTYFSGGFQDLVIRSMNPGIAIPANSVVDSLTETSTITAKLMFSQPLVGTVLALFGGLDAGWAMSKSGWKITGLNIANQTALTTLIGATGVGPITQNTGGIVGTATGGIGTAGWLQNMMDFSTVAVTMYSGFGIKMNSVFLDMQLLVGIMSLKFGFSLGVRFQQ
jgi:hypothetical protein